MDDPTVVTPPPEPTPAPAPEPAKPSHRDAIKQRSLSHNIATCLCPYCRQRRKQQNIPNPPEHRKPRSPKPPKPAPVTPAPITTTTTGEQHDPTTCLCPPCTQWRKDRASAAAKARYEKAATNSFDWVNAPMAEAEQHLGQLRHEIEYGARILRDRTSTSSQQFVKCYVCHKDIINGRWAQSRVLVDPITKLPHNIFLCSSSCVAAQSIHPEQHGPSTGEPTGLHPEQRPH